MTRQSRAQAGLRMLQHASAQPCIGVPHICDGQLGPSNTSRQQHSDSNRDSMQSDSEQAAAAVSSSVDHSDSIMVDAKYMSGSVLCKSELADGNPTVSGQKQ